MFHVEQWQGYSIDTVLVDYIYNRVKIRYTVVVVATTVFFWVYRRSGRTSLVELA